MEEDDFEEIPDLVEVPYDNNKVVPVTILTGFLGSGKTTLLNHILTADHNRRIAVIENEFSSGLGIESMIAKSGIDGENISNFFELNNGCICCTVKDDLLQTLEQLVLHKDRFDYVLIETTGLANPGPVISSFWSDDEVGSCLKLDGVVCVVDAVNMCDYITNPDIQHEVKQQLCYADRILLNKTDLIQPEKIHSIETIIRNINSFAPIEKTVQSKVDLNFILGIDCYSLENSPLNYPQCFPCNDLIQKAFKQGHEIASLNSVALQFKGDLDLNKMRSTLDLILYRNGESSSNEPKSVERISEEDKWKGMKIYRMKGMLNIEKFQYQHILQAVHNIFDIQVSTYLKPNPLSSENTNSIIIIGSRLDAELLRKTIEACVIKKD